MINIMCGVLSIVTLSWIARLITTNVSDIGFQWQAARNFATYGEPYHLQGWLQPISGVPPPVYVYPPLIAWLFQPLALFPLVWAQYIWFGINVGLLWTYMRLCWKHNSSRILSRWWGPAVLVGTVASPTSVTLQLGQVSLLLACLITLGATDGVGIRGGMWAVGTAIKLFPGWLFGWSLLRRQWRVLGMGIVVGIGTSLLPMLPYGTVPYRAFSQVLQLAQYPYAAQFNVSIWGFWQRLLTQHAYGVAPLIQPQLAQILGGLSILVVVMLTAWSTAQGRQGDEWAGLAVWITGMLLLVPSNGFYNLVMLMWPLCWCIRRLEMRPQRGLVRRLLLSVLLCWIPPGWEGLHPAVYNFAHRGWGLLALVPSFYGLVGIFAVCVVLSRQAIRSESWG